MADRQVPLQPSIHGSNLPKRRAIVSDLRGLHVRDAEMALAEAGFSSARYGSPVVVRYVEAYAPEWTVIGHTPTHGQLADTSAPVQLDVARQGWGQFLPRYMSSGTDDATQIGQFLKIFQQVHDGVRARIDGFTDWMDPLAVDVAYLPWLASWMGVQLELDWTDAQKRLWLQQAPQLFARRGTRMALLAILRVHFGREVEVIENTWSFVPMTIGVASEIGVSSTILAGLELQHAFVVALPVAAAQLSATQVEQLHRLIVAEKPAHTTYCLQFLETTDSLSSEGKDG